MTEETALIKTELARLKQEFGKLLDAQSKTLALIEELSFSTHAATLAIIETLEENGLDKTKFMVRLDELSQTLYPDSETFGALNALTLGILLREPASRRKLPSATRE